MKMWFNKTMLSLLCAVFIGAGCSTQEEAPPGPEFSGKPEPAVVDANNAQAMGTGAFEGAQQAINTVTTNMESLAKVIYNGMSAYAGTSQNSSNDLPAGISIAATVISQRFCGGFISTNDLIIFGFTEATLVFQDVCYESQNGGQVMMDGHVVLSRTQTAFTIKFVEFTVTRNDETQLFNYAITCEQSVCTAISDFVGSDGQTYRIADFNIGGDNVSGYTVSATFFHPVFGSATLETTTAITFNCDSGHPDAGTLVFTGYNGTSGSISFRSDCTGYDGTYNDGVNSGAFSGDWN